MRNEAITHRRVERSTTTVTDEGATLFIAFSIVEVTGKARRIKIVNLARTRVKGQNALLLPV